MNRTMSPTCNRPLSSSLASALAVALVIAAGAHPAAAATSAHRTAIPERVTLFTPGLGARVLANGEPIEIEILPGDSAAVSDIYLTRLFTVPVRLLLGTNRDVGKVVSVTSFNPEEELRFEITVRSTGLTYYSGPASRNPDGLAHAWVTSTGPTAVNVAFEDVFGGGDQDFNDVLVNVRMGTRSSGLDHRRLGDADLSTTQDGAVALSNLSDSGEDGMAASLGEVTGWRFSATGIQRAGTSSAAETTLQARGVAAGVKQEVGRVRVVAEQGRSRIGADFTALGARGARVTVYGQGRRQIAREMMANAAPAELICPSLDLLSSLALLGRVEISHPAGGRTVTIVIDGIEAWNCTLSPLDLPGMAASQQERVTALELTAVEPALEPELISEALLQTRGIRAMTIAREALQIAPEGPFHRGLGRATLDAVAGALTVGRLGPSGEEGVAIDPGGPAEAVAVAYAPPPPPLQVPGGAFLQLGTRGTTEAAGEQELGTLRLTANDDVVELSTDYSPVGSSSRRIVVLDQDRAVADVAGPAGPAARTGAWPDGARSGRFRLDGRSFWGYSLHFDRQERIEIPGGTAVIGDRILVLAEGPGVPVESVSEVRLQGAQMPPITLLDEEVTPLPAPTCVPDDHSLCLNGGRFRVGVTWRTPQGASGLGHAVRLTDDTGTFWFFRPENLELVVKTLDACSFVDRFWVFAAGLTDVEVEMTVTDTLTGDTRRYHNPQRSPFQPILDTTAFATCAASSSAVSHSRPAASTGTSASSSLLLNGGRFRVEVAWTTPQGQTGVGQAVQLTEDTGYFWFFAPDNVELLVKTLDACAFVDRFWVFAGGLTDVDVEITVTDTSTHQVRRYHNPQRTPFAPVLDTSAFATCP